MKKTVVFLIGFSISVWGVYADIADQVVLVRTEYPDSVVENYERIADWLENSGSRGLAERFRGQALGGFGSGSVIRTPGGRILVLTNYHVVAQSSTVTLEYAGRSGSGAKFENCRVIAADIERDIALVEVPEQARELAAPLSFDEALQRDGAEVWSAGYPGLISSPSWQLATGTVTNQEAVIPELRVPQLDYVIQHSAIIGPGSSGGPLLLRVGDDDYRIVGVNTWRYGGRDNTYFAIPAAEAAAYIDEYGDMEVVPETAELEERLRDSADRFIAEFTAGGKLDTRRIKNLVSDELVSDIGWSSYLDYRKGLESDEREQLDADFVSRDSYDAMKEAVADRIGALAGDEGGEVVRIRTPVDPELTEVDYRLGESDEVIGWKWEMNRWVIRSLSFIDADKADKMEEDSRKKRSSGLIDRDLKSASVTVRGGGVLPVISSPNSSIDSKSEMGFGLGVAVDFFPSPFFGWGLGMEYHQNSFSLSTGGEKIKVQNLTFPFTLRFQVPLRVSGGSITLIPWVSAALSFGVDIARLSPRSDIGGPSLPIHIQAPLSLGFEMTTEKVRDTVIWGVELSYVLPVFNQNQEFYGLKEGFDNRKFTISHLRFGAAVRFPY